MLKSRSSGKSKSRSKIRNHCTSMCEQLVTIFWTGSTSLPAHISQAFFARRLGLFLSALHFSSFDFSFEQFGIIIRAHVLRAFGNIQDFQGRLLEQLPRNVQWSCYARAYSYMSTHVCGPTVPTNAGG